MTNRSRPNPVISAPPAVFDEHQTDTRVAALCQRCARGGEVLRDFGWLATGEGYRRYGP
jgi:hypothetical protein